jgi:IS1 family transposase
MTGVAKHTVLKLVEDMGCACAAYHHRNVRGLKVRRLQCDEIWAFVGAKAKNVSVEKKAEGWGDAWTWTAIDADTKLCVSYLVGGRSTGWAVDFMQDCAYRIVGKPQITTDAHKPYLKAVEEAFGGDADYAMLHKIYGAPDEGMSMRRFTRLTNGFSKKIENHGHAVALHFMHYNFCRVHKTLRVTPTMEAGLANSVWTIEELVENLLA